MLKAEKYRCGLPPCKKITLNSCLLIYNRMRFDIQNDNAEKLENHKRPFESSYCTLFLIHL